MCEYRMPSAVEAGLNAKAYFAAFRGLCKLRIAYAQRKQKEYRLNWTLGSTEDKNKYMEKEQFWSKVEVYWKIKLEESYKREKEYFGEA